MSIYYVYAYVRNSDGTPYYIGKGKGRRAYQSHNVSVPADRSKIVFLHENLDEQTAHELEKSYIAEYGRKDLGTGILHNRTDGGEGTAGWFASEETKRKMSKSRAGKPLSDQHKKRVGNRHRGKTISEETKEKLRNMAKQQFADGMPDETKQKISSHFKGKVFANNGKICKRVETIPEGWVKGRLPYKRRTIS